MRLVYKRPENLIVVLRGFDVVASYECRHDFFPGENSEGQPRASLPAGLYQVSADEPPAEDSDEYGTFYITTGDYRGRDIHGGGSGLDDPKAPLQGWYPTLGCLRMQNKHGQELSRLIIGDGNSVQLEVLE